MTAPLDPREHLDPLVLFDHAVAPELVAPTDDMSLGTSSSTHLDTCATCQRDLQRTHEALHLLPLALPARAPAPALRARLLAAVARPLTDHAAALATMFDRPEPELHALLTRVMADTIAWTPFLPGIEHHAIRTRTGDGGGLLRVTPGVPFPRHLHHTDEHLRILQGSCTDSTGLVLGPGDELHNTSGSTHALTSHPGPPLLLAYRGGRAELLDNPA